jgi:hypothetical protein
VKAKLMKQKTLDFGKDIDSALTNEPVVRPENLRQLVSEEIIKEQKATKKKVEHESQKIFGWVGVGQGKGKDQAKAGQW